jgi:hypothetical protein
VAYAIRVEGNGCMPAFSHLPYPTNGLMNAFAPTFERYQSISFLIAATGFFSFMESELPSLSLDGISKSEIGNTKQEQMAKSRNSKRSDREMVRCCI